MRLQSGLYPQGGLEVLNSQVSDVRNQELCTGRRESALRKVRDLVDREREEECGRETGSVI